MYVINRIKSNFVFKCFLYEVIGCCLILTLGYFADIALKWQIQYFFHAIALLFFAGTIVALIREIIKLHDNVTRYKEINKDRQRGLLQKEIKQILKRKLHEETFPGGNEWGPLCNAALNALNSGLSIKEINILLSNGGLKSIFVNTIVSFDHHMTGRTFGQFNLYRREGKDKDSNRHITQLILM